ncbi:hypothetical protein [Aliivibrio fischeri]|uniref:hypothetical protein n=1 Tax=Aliivibrio fischeri TaxID=668 RepID=UPI001F18F3CA|nr:hypothetical protein [Aliivibrio fischeri]MCE7556578.1 hypothetical protein [Aliivibrio fischeri]MCE7564001.1 hypothetical protein [Aliivibrio fischeri]MCE7571485.1 hypothetical protein [Aliivibrio fischeri]
MKLWERTKSVAKMYTGTFIVVMLLNQLVFFGFCLNPICIIAAMPHVLAITAFLGSWLNKESGWGDNSKAGNVGKVLKESKTIINKSIEEAAEELEKINASNNEKQIKLRDKLKITTVDEKYKRKTIQNSFVNIDKLNINKEQSYNSCRKCGAETVLRVAKKGPYSGKQFYGCSKYPQCNGIINIS